MSKPFAPRTPAPPRLSTCLLACALAAGCSADTDGDGQPALFSDAGSATGNGPGNAAQPHASDADVSPAGIPPSDQDAARALAALERLGAHALADLAAKLETGAPMEAAERACLGAYDPALGEPLSALDCDMPLPVAGTPVAVRQVRMRTDDTCRPILGQAARSAADVAAGCDWADATIRLATEWVPPPRQPDGDHQGRPRPLPGATFDYLADAPATLVATSLESRLTGPFTCTANLVTGQVQGGTGCAAGMADFAIRLEVLADALDASVRN